MVGTLSRRGALPHTPVPRESACVYPRVIFRTASLWLKRSGAAAVHDSAQNNEATPSGKPPQCRVCARFVHERRPGTPEVDTDLGTKEDETAWTGRNGRHGPDTQTLISVTEAARRQRPGRLPFSATKSLQ
jgi:hypothetical protein